MEADKSSFKVRSVEKAMGILELFDADRPSLTLQDVVQLTGLNRATAYRFCQALLFLGFLERTGDRSYRRGMKTLLLGHAAFATLELPEIAWPYLEELQTATGETANLAVRDGAEIVISNEAQVVSVSQYPTLCGKQAPRLLHLNGQSDPCLSPCGRVEAGDR